MNLSGIVVAVSPAFIDSCIEQLNALPGIEVHNIDREKGRLVVVQEAESISAEVEGLKAIKALSHVTFAEMVYHYFAEDEQFIEAIPEDLDAMTGLQQQACVPEYLQD
jgi:nitrate reductase NapD